MKKNLEPIAVIGLGAIMPGALNKDTFWKNIIEGKNCIKEVPATHWDPKLFYDPDHKAEDKTYSKIGGFIEGFTFNSLKYRIPPQVAKQMDTVQQLAIETTAMALEDSGYDKKTFDRTRTAVIIGNAMGGMKGEMSNTRANKQYFYEIIKNTSSFQQLDPASAQALMSEIEAGVAQKFMPITEDTMPGELANVIAGRVANVFDVNGTNFAVDAACATSLAAIDQAVNGLRMGNYDMVLCGGVDQMMSPSAFIKFSKIGALSADGSYPFDARANGFVMAEGAGMVVLKRLSDAEKDGDKIYCVIRAVGASSDGKGKGITAPNPKGQKIAVEKAFEQLDYTPADVSLIEAHGTSTSVGDKVEVNALAEVFGSAPHGSIGLGSIKSQIGHAKAAAGIASFIKVSMALHTKTLPPSINFVTPNPNVDWANCPFRVVTKAEEWSGAKIRRANVSSFGFGGTNFHVAVEEYHEGLKNFKAEVCEAQISAPVKENSVNNNKYELLTDAAKIEGEMLVFTGDTKEALFAELAEAVRASAADPKYIAKAAYANHTKQHKKFSVVINVENNAKLKEKAEFFIKTAGAMDVWTQDSLHLRMKGIYPFYPSHNTPKVAFMFPGQGSQYVDMMKDLASKYKVVKDTFDEADVILKDLINTTLTEVIWSKEGESKEQHAAREEAIKQTQMTQPAVMTADVAMMRLLSSFGIKPEVVMGHSLGEYAAAVAAGIFDFENGLKSVTNRAKAMSDIKVEDPGGMVSVFAPVDKVSPELAKISGYIDIANKNCPTQTVVAGDTKAVTQAIKMFTDMGIQAVRVPVSHAFHSKVISPATEKYRAFLNTLEVSAPKLPITSNVTADFFPKEPGAIKDLLVKQLVSSVEWIEQLKRTYDSGVRLFVECGPKRVLSAFATSTLDDKKDIKVLASNHPKKGGISEFNDLLANLTASGIELNWKGTDYAGDAAVMNPAYTGWVKGEENKTEEKVSMPVSENKFTAGPVTADSIVISGVAAGAPGSWEKVFRDGALDEILQGRNLIETIPAELQQKQVNKNVQQIIKSPDGNHRVEHLDSIAGAIKLYGKAGAFDAVHDFGLPEKWVASMDRSASLSIAAGLLALKDAGVPLVQYYKPTTAGGFLPDRWGLPENMIEDTGVVAVSAFTNVNSIAKEVSETVAAELSGKTEEEVYKFYDYLIGKITDGALRREISAWFASNFSAAQAKEKTFAQDFLLKTLPLAHSNFCQWVRAMGPSVTISGACSSTSQAIATATDWIKLGRAKRVVVIGADDISNDDVMEFCVTGFLTSGAATTEGDVTKAALPFDKRRNGMIVGMGAIGLVIEKEADVAARGMKPLAKILEADMRNSAFHPTRLDINHVAKVMNEVVSAAERDYGLNRKDMAGNLVFISHETYTPARGGSASAEVHALKTTFGPDVEKVIVSNTKGFTGHSMGASLEDAIAVRALSTGIVPPIANYKEADPELAGINLSKGGKYNFKYALRVSAGFGSQMGMTLLEKKWDVSEPRIFDNAAYQAWLKAVSAQSAPVLEVVNNTLRVKDNFVPGVKPALVMAGSQAFVDKVTSAFVENKPEVIARAESPRQSPVVVSAPAPVAAVNNLDEATVRTELLNLISEKTGYPVDMLDPDLDMEADLGIDTVKQAELFASVREKYNIPAKDGIQLKDYPTINHMVKFVLGGASAPAVAAVPAPTVEAAPAVNARAESPRQSPAGQSLDEASVKAELLNLISEKTGYPIDMLDPELDMEADLGIDTVKQAELFASVREKYSIPAQEGIQLKDYPTINHMVKFVLGGASAPAVAAVPAPAVVAPAPVPAPAPVAAAASNLNEAEVRTELLNIISEKTGYPIDMLDPELDMEADLGIDTVKQAELFASVREKYSIPAQEGIQLKDYPTINHMVKFVLGGTSASAPAVAPVVAPAPVAVESAPLSAAALAPASAVSKDSDAVKEDLLNIISEKTGYPKDMLDPELDMEADLGIDTVKQAELFASIREKYNIPAREGIQLKDYPTINHMVKFVTDGADAPAETTAAPQAQPAAVPAAATSAQPAAVEPAPAPEPVIQAAPAPYKGEDCHSKKLRYVPTVVDAPLTETGSRKLSTERPVLIFADNSQLIKAYQDEFKKINVKTHVFTTLKARSKNTTIVNWDSYEETEAVLKQFQQENPGTQGIVYLLGASVKKFDKKLNPHNELTRYVMPLFIACRVFEKDLADRTNADTFMLTSLKLDGGFGYVTKEEINPVIGALSGGAQCFRKDMFELTGCISKLMDFDENTDIPEMAAKSVHEILKGDMRFMVSYLNGKRTTMLSLPTRLKKDVKHMDLAGKTIVFTGSGRGIGAMLSQKIAEQYHSKIIMLDIIEITEKTAVHATMNEAELSALKNQMWAEMKADPNVKATPVMLDRAFGAVKDSIGLYKNLEILRRLGSEVEYYHCDVMNGTMMKDVATKIKAKNGRVDGLIHFAGLERSKLVTEKAPEEYYRIFDVKATSAAAFYALNLVKEDGFYAFASSIAGKYGNLGQSDYASANDYLAKMSLSLNNIGIRAISVAMSAYKNVGMGVRAGVETFLKTNGVEFVDPEDGMQIFLDEIVYGTVPEIVLTDVLGKLDWDRQVKSDWDEIGAGEDVKPSGNGGSNGGNSGGALKENHFLGEIEELEPGKKIFAKKEFTLESDHYLIDHAIEGTPYVPGVMGAETFVEAAAMMNGVVPQGLEDVHYYLPIKLLRNRPQEVMIRGGAEGFEIESDFINSKGIKMGNTRKHFTARVLGSFESKWNAVKGKINLNAGVKVTKEEIYKKYFHGPSFQVMSAVCDVTENTVLAKYTRPEAKLFTDGDKKLLAYPMLIEAAFQCCGWRDLVIENRSTLPDSIGKLIIHGKGESPKELWLFSQFNGMTIEGKSMFDAYAFDENMNLWIELQDYQMIGQ